MVKLHRGSESVKWHNDFYSKVLEVHGRRIVRTTVCVRQGEKVFYKETIKEDRTQENSAKVGTYLMTELAKLRDKYEIIGDVRGKGLQIRVEMVKDKVGRDPLPSQAMAQIFEDTKDMGVLIGKGGLYGQTFRIQPPMCITKDDADFFLTVFNQAVLNYMEKR